jgi:hypothetical protein
MPTPGSPAAPISGDLDITVVDRGGTTMTQHAMALSGRLTFQNLSGGTLTITCTSGHHAPFLVEGCANAVASFTVQGTEPKVVRIADGLDVGDSIKYTAQIEGTIKEDPVIIFDRR